MKKILLISFAILLVAIGVTSFFLYKKYAVRVDTQKRQAVFLTNGQVYFGHITKINQSSITLTDIYYLKTQDQLDPNDTETKKKIALIKLGEEVHGPEDKMTVNRQNVLFWEEMKDSSKINEAINNFVAQKK